MKDKYFIKRNIKTVIKMDRDQKVRRSADARQGWQHRNGELPQYLINRKQEAEREKAETLQHIE